MRMQEARLGLGLITALGLIVCVTAATPRSAAPVLTSRVSTSAAADAAAGAGADTALAQAPACKPWVEPKGPVYTRHNIATFTKAQWIALDTAVTTMKGRAATDPTSWLYQANIHGTYDSPVQPSWNTCQHGNYLFLNWHRMYLYFFERILRKASGSPDFALPYWNYSIVAQSALPKRFRDPASTTNPLYVAQRAAAINAGSMVPASATSFSVAFSYINFTSPPGSGLSFGGPQVPGPVHFGSPPGRLESLPHNAIHNVVGGGSGWMGDPNMAARDPIFWLHHANIDRLWTRWIALGGGRADPPASDTVWQTTPFKFFDETGACVIMTGAQVEKTATQLHYRYDDVRVPLPPIHTTALPTTGGAAASATNGGPQKVLAEMAKEGGVQLSGERTSVPVEIKAEQKSVLMSAARPTAPERLAIVLDGIDYEPGAFYEVYLNLPDSEKDPTSTSPYFIGVLSPFAMKPHDGSKADIKLDFEVTDVVKGLAAKKLWSGDTVSVTFVPGGAGGGAAAAREVSKSKITIDHVRLVLAQ